MPIGPSFANIRVSKKSGCAATRCHVKSMREACSSGWSYLRPMRTCSAAPPAVRAMFPGFVYQLGGDALSVVRDQHRLREIEAGLGRLEGGAVRGDQLLA